MPQTMTVRNVDDEIYSRLSTLAKKQRRSLNAQVLAILEEALMRENARAGSVADLLAEAERIRHTVRRRKGAPDSAEVLRRARAERGA